VEVDLCSYVTLASAFVLFNVPDYPEKIIGFQSLRSGMLFIEK
jgi:hypothetical protein